MNLAELSIKRPIFITCLIILMIAAGLISIAKMPVNLFPDVTFPIVTVTTGYRGAAPKEVELQVSKVIEEELSTVTGLKSLKSINKENVSIIVAEFEMSVDIKYAEQQVRDKVSSAKRELPNDIEEPVIRRVDPADQPIVGIALTADLNESELYDLADIRVKPLFEQINNVGLVQILGGRKREIKVELDREKLRLREISASSVAQRIGLAGANVPAGSVDVNAKNRTVFRTTGEFQNLGQIEKTIVNFFGNENPLTVKDVGRVVESLEDEKSIAYVNGKKTLLFQVYRQSGSNTVAVAKAVKDKIDIINKTIANGKGAPKLVLVRDGSKAIDDNVYDVKESIIIGILLTVVVVYLFLASLRSTIITGLALPNSLIGAFILMTMFGFSINILTLLALTLSVGLLIDDAIVVRENIFRHIEMGKDPLTASLEGTKEVTLAVIGVSLTILAVFGPIAFLQGVIGQFFKEFGMTICFIIIISTFDALTIAPMLSTYFAGGGHHGHSDAPPKGFYEHTFGRMLKGFDKFQTWLENLYEKALHVVLRRPLITLLISFGVFAFSIYVASFVNKTFLPPQDNGEFTVALDMMPGTSLEEMNKIASAVDVKMRSNKEVKMSLLTVGNADAEYNKADFYVQLVPRKERTMNTSEFKESLREQLKEFKIANPVVKDFDATGGGQRPFTLMIVGSDLEQVEKISQLAFEKLKNNPSLKDVDTSYRPGKPEFQVVPNRTRAETMGVSTTLLGNELRTQVEGTVASVYRVNGEEYDIRVRSQEDQRNLKESFNKILIPNINGRLVKLNSVAVPFETTGPATINRVDRGRYYEVLADISPTGKGMGGAIADVHKMFKDDIKLPEGVTYRFSGQAENFGELIVNMSIAAALGVMFIYLVLSSLYESFVTPFTIMLVIPLAICGAIFALYLTNSYLDLFSMIGCIMLMGVGIKNSIILVDFTVQKIHEGIEMKEAVILAGKTRLRPILMTSFAFAAGMIPIAIGLNEASAQRTSLGIAVIGGTVSSTLLSLIVVPAAFSYIERFRIWSLTKMKKIFVA